MGSPLYDHEIDAQPPAVGKPAVAAKGEKGRRLHIVVGAILVYCAGFYVLLLFPTATIALAPGWASPWLGLAWALGIVALDGPAI